MYELEEEPGVRWSREELQVVPEKRTIIPRQQQSDMGPVPAETLQEVKAAVREETEQGKFSHAINPWIKLFERTQ